MTDRIPLDAMTSDQLDALYERLEAAEESETQRQLAVAREALASATIHAARTEAAVTRVRALHLEAYGCCEECTNSHAVLWPCPTIQALDAPAPAPAASEAPARACRIAAGGGFACPTHDPCTTCDKER